MFFLSLLSPSPPPVSLLLLRLPPPIAAQPLVPIAILTAMQIDPTPRHAIRRAEPNGGPAHDPADAEFCAQRLPPAQRQQGVQAGPGGGEACAGGGIAREVEVGREEERWGEEREGEGLEGTRVEGGDERCEEGGGEGGCWRS